jgi:hypothetical protein
MPVKIVRSHDGTGYYVEDVHSRKRHSDSPMTYENAVKQARILNRVDALSHAHHHSAEPHHWIAEMHMKKGAFTRQAKAHGETVPEFEEEVLEAPEKFSRKTVKRARLAETLSHLGK